jgi:hypothetical protein
MKIAFNEFKMTYPWSFMMLKPIVLDGYAPKNQHLPNTHHRFFRLYLCF